MIEFPVMERDALNRSKFGWLLKKNADRIVDGLMFERVDGTERTAWKVVRVAAKSPTSPALPDLVWQVQKVVTDAKSMEE